MAGLLLLLAALAMTGPDEATRLPPVEQCAAEPGFETFRSRLRQVVANKDEAGLLAMLSDDIEVNFGGDHGPRLFAANWKFDEPGDSRVWTELEEALRFGCTPTGDALIAPSFSAQFPDELDPFETVIAPPETRLRAAPADNARTLADLDWHLLSVSEWTDPAWIPAKLRDGRQGFVRRNQVINPLDYRLVFEKRAGEWMITAFVAGD